MSDFKAQIKWLFIYFTIDNIKGQVFNCVKSSKPGLSTDEMRVSGLSSTWMESGHEGDQRTSRLSCGGAG
jgi:hypothetical protein